MKKKGESTGSELNFSKTQINKMTKMGGILPLLPLILGGLGALGSLAGFAANIAKTVLDNKANDFANAEAARHNREVEMQLKDSGLFLILNVRLLLADAVQCVKVVGCFFQKT